MTFTNDELYMLSGAVLCAIGANNRAAELACGDGAINALLGSNRQLRDLNTKLCAMMRSGDGEIEATGKKDNGLPNVFVTVEDGLVRSVYANVPGLTATVFDFDVDVEYRVPEEEEQYQKMLADPDYKEIW